MATKWYQKATVQGALVAAAALIIVTSVPIALQVPNLNDEIRFLERKLGERSAEIQRLETQLAPFKTIALARYTGPENEALAKLAGQVELLQRLDEEKTAKIKALEESIQKTSAQASPPKLTLESYEISDVNEGKVLSLRFAPSKNVPLGIVMFNAEVSKFVLGPPAKILDFRPNAKFGAFQSGEDSKKISNDGFSARLAYQPMGAGPLSVNLTLSSGATVTLKGNYLGAPITLEVSKATKKTPN